MYNIFNARMSVVPFFQLPTRFELVLLDSKSNVLTSTLWKQRLCRVYATTHAK